MPTFTYMTRCDGCGECVDICPSDIMHIDPVYRRSYNIEPNFCWECYSCVKACPQHAIDVRDSPTSRRWATVSGCCGKRRAAPSPGRSATGRAGEGVQLPDPDHPLGSIKPPTDYAAPDADALNSPLLAHEPRC